MVTISLCMIVRNEEAILKRCLESFKDIVDEIIIIDTGSTDSTKKIASDYTNLIFDFTWENDFSAARNESFLKATMDYCMWADADDVFSPKEAAKLLKWKKNMSPDAAPDVVMLKYATAFHKNEIPSFLYYRERLLRNGRGFHWKGRVHEAIVPAGKIEYLDIYLEHRSIKTSYSTRNLNIYRDMLTRGDTFEPRDYFYYARELYYHKHYPEALEQFSFFLSLPEGFTENKVDACRFAAYCSYFLQKDADALLFLLKGLSFRTPGGELCCDIGKHFLDRKDYEQAAFWYHAALHAPLHTENGGFIDTDCYGYLPCIQLSVCYDRLGLTQQALTYHKKAGSHKPNDELFLKNEVYFSQKGSLHREHNL